MSSAPSRDLQADYAKFAAQTHCGVCFEPLPVGKCRRQNCVHQDEPAVPEFLRKPAIAVNRATIAQDALAMPGAYQESSEAQERAKTQPSAISDHQWKTCPCSKCVDRRMNEVIAMVRKSGGENIKWTEAPRFSRSHMVAAVVFLFLGLLIGWGVWR